MLAVNLQRASQRLWWRGEWGGKASGGGREGREGREGRTTQQHVMQREGVGGQIPQGLLVPGWLGLAWLEVFPPMSACTACTTCTACTALVTTHLAATAKQARPELFCLHARPAVGRLDARVREGAESGLAMRKARQGLSGVLPVQVEERALALGCLRRCLQTRLLRRS